MQEKRKYVKKARKRNNENIKGEAATKTTERKQSIMNIPTGVSLSIYNGMEQRDFY